MAEDYTFNIKLNFDTADKTKSGSGRSRSDSEMERLLNKASKVLEDISSLDIRAMKSAYSRRPMSRTAMGADRERIAQEKSAIEEHIALLRGMRAFSPGIDPKEWAKGKKDTDPTKAFKKGYAKPLEKAELQTELRKELDRRFHSSNQALGQIQKSLEQQRDTFLKQYKEVKSLVKPTTTTTFAGERISVTPERTLQQMVAPSIFTRQLELQMEKLVKTNKAEIAKEAKRVKGFIREFTGL